MRRGQAGLQYALIMGVMGFIMPGIDNSAHLGGFAGGYLASLILDPLKPERVDHLALAVVCLLITFVAIVASVITALPYFQPHEDRRSSPTRRRSRRPLLRPQGGHRVNS